LVKVLRNFVMPTSQIVPNYEGFITLLYEAQLFGPRIYGREVAKPALKILGIDSVKAVEEGISRSRMTPTSDGMAQPEYPFLGCNFSVLESTVRSLFNRVTRYEGEVGLADLHPTVFVPVEW
jgi:acyl-[acyl-carrier-protein] desaturase